jgi:MFS family permease
MASNVAQGSTRLILIGSAMLLSIGMGLRQSLGLFLTPVTRDLALTAADFTLTIAIQNIVWGLSQAPVGAIADRFGLRVTLVAGTVIYIAGLATMAAGDGEMALIVSGVLIGIALSCTASSLALAACARAVPEQRRSKMLGVVAAVGSLGTLIVPLATQGVLKYYPWQIGALFFAILAAAMLPAAFWAGASDKLPLMMAEAKTTMRNARAGAAPSRLSRDVGSLFRLRTEPCLSYDAPAGVPGNLRPGPDAERRGAGGHRRCQLRRCLAGGLARRPVSEARRVGLAL